MNPLSKEDALSEMKRLRKELGLGDKADVVRVKAIIKRIGGFE